MKFQHPDILIIGDSFCHNRIDLEQWPYLFHHLLTDDLTIPRGYGYGGNSWWSVRRLLLKEIARRPPRVLVLCHTEYNRIPSNHNVSLNFSSIEQGELWALGQQLDDDRQARLVEAGRLYYRDLWFDEYHQWAQLAWFRELDQLLEQWSIPYVIHLHCFSNNYTFKNGYTHSRVLSEISSNGPNHRGHNHFTPRENQLFGQELAQIVQSM